MRLVAAAAICCSLLALGLVGFSRNVPEQTQGTFPGSIPVPYTRFSPARVDTSDPARTTLIVHGLNSNKEFMHLLAMTMADAGFEAWAIDLPGHGDSPARFNSEASEQAIETALASLPADTIVMGHSLGAGLLADLSMLRRFDTAILLSPPPIPLTRVNVERLLVVTGRFDAPRINAAIPALVEAAGSDTEWWRFRWAGHSSALVNPLQHRMIVEWAGGSSSGLRASTRLWWLGLMILAALVVPATSLRLAQRTGMLASPKFHRPDESDPSLNIVMWISGLGAAVALLTLFNPVSWLRLFRTDYLVGLLLVTGLVLWRGRRVGMSLRGAFWSLVGAAYIILVMVVVGSPVMHLIPSGEQWLRFPILTALSLPLFFHDELAVRGRGFLQGWGWFLFTRLLIWSALMTGVLLFNTDAAFLVLIAHLVVLAWLPLWWLAGIVARATGEPGAAALFSALVQGWVFSALFVTI